MLKQAFVMFWTKDGSGNKRVVPEGVLCVVGNKKQLADDAVIDEVDREVILEQVRNRDGERFMAGGDGEVSEGDEDLRKIQLALLIATGVIICSYFVAKALF